MNLKTLAPALALTAAGALAAPAGASSYDVYAEVAALNPGTSAAQVKAEARASAGSRSTTPDQIAGQWLAEGRREAASAARISSDPFKGGGSRPLGAARHRGDIFWKDTLVDHVGIYYRTDMITDAPGRGEVVRTIGRHRVLVPAHTEKMYVKTSQAKRTAAAIWAHSKRGFKYRSAFFNNRKVNDSKYNCSQLVWAAFKAKARIDIDSNKGFGVYPGNVRASDYTVTYSRRQA